MVEFIQQLTPQKVFQMKKNIHRTVTTSEHFDQLMNIYEEVLIEK